MKTFSYFYLISFFLVFVLSGCQDVKKGFSQKKMDQGNEFLVIKKNPLIVPPDFDELPKPKEKNNSNENLKSNNNSENEFKILLEKNESTSIQSNSTDKTGTLEENILNQIKK